MNWNFTRDTFNPLVVFGGIHGLVISKGIEVTTNLIKKGIQDIEDAIKELETQKERVAKQIDYYKQDRENYADELNRWNKLLTVIEDRIGKHKVEKKKLQQEIEKVNKEYSETKKKLEDAKLNKIQTQKKADEITKLREENIKEVNQLQEKLNVLNNQKELLDERLKNGKLEETEVQRQQRILELEETKTKRKLERLESQIKKIESEIEKLNQQKDELEEELLQLEEQIQELTMQKDELQRQFEENELKQQEHKNRITIIQKQIDNLQKKILDLIAKVSSIKDYQETHKSNCSSYPISISRQAERDNVNHMIRQLQDQLRRLQDDQTYHYREIDRLSSESSKLVSQKEQVALKLLFCENKQKRNQARLTEINSKLESNNKLLGKISSQRDKIEGELDTISLKRSMLNMDDQEVKEMLSKLNQEQSEISNKEKEVRTELSIKNDELEKFTKENQKVIDEVKELTLQEKQFLDKVKCKNSELLNLEHKDQTNRMDQHDAIRNVGFIENMQMNTKNLVEKGVETHSEFQKEINKFSNVQTNALQKADNILRIANTVEEAANLFRKENQAMNYQIDSINLNK